MQIKCKSCHIWGLLCYFIRDKNGSNFSQMEVPPLPLKASHLDPPANGQAVIYLTGLLEVFISESSILATVSDNSVRYQAVNVVKR